MEGSLTSLNSHCGRCLIVAGSSGSRRTRARSARRRHHDQSRKTLRTTVLVMRLGLAPMRGGPVRVQSLRRMIASPRRSHGRLPELVCREARVMIAATPWGVRGKPPAGRRRLSPRRGPWRSRKELERDGSDERF
jgi:hypothetical protein